MTELKRHPHADVLIAIAAGKGVQYLAGSDSIWRNCNIENFSPCTHPSFQWRVKPQKQKRWVNVYPSDIVAYENTYLTKAQATKEAGDDRIACIEIDFEEGEGL